MSDFEEVTFEEVCGQPLSNSRASYYFQQGMRHKRRNGINGMMMEIVLPEFTGSKTLSIANRMPPETPFVQTGLLLEGPDITEGRLDARLWGYGGSLRYTFSSEWSGRSVFVFHAIDKVSQRYENWISDLVFYWR